MHKNRVSKCILRAARFKPNNVRNCIGICFLLRTVSSAYFSLAVLLCALTHFIYSFLFTMFWANKCDCTISDATVYLFLLKVLVLYLSCSLRRWRLCQSHHCGPFSSSWCWCVSDSARRYTNLDFILCASFHLKSCNVRSQSYVQKLILQCLPSYKVNCTMLQCNSNAVAT